MSFITNVRPITAKILNKLEPRIFPTAISDSPFEAATSEVASSGIDVPRATIVIPIAREDTPKYLAIEIAPLTNKSDPSHSPITPAKNNMTNWFLQFPLITQILIVYLLGINLLTFFFFGIDKLKSQWKKRRVSEKQLWFLCLIGGSIGGLLAMKYFRHKTKKTSFQTVLILIIAVQITAIILYAIQ